MILRSLVLAAPALAATVGQPAPAFTAADVKTAKTLALAALADVKAGKPVKVATSKPYGCSVKYG